MTAWRWYGGIATLLTLLSPFAYLDMVAEPRAVDLVDFLFTVAGTAGLVAFSWRRKLGSRALWQILGPVILIWSLVYWFLIPEPSMKPEFAEDGLPVWVDQIMTIILTSPLFVALYLYAYRDPFPWDSPAPDSGSDKYPLPPYDPETEGPRLGLLLQDRTDRYLERFARFAGDAPGKPKFALSWNWGAAAFGDFWLFYRKMWVLAAVFLLIQPVGLTYELPAAFVPKTEFYWLVVSAVIGLLIERSAFGLLADYAYFRHLRKKLYRLDKEHGPGIPDDVIESAGGTSIAAPLIVAGAGVVLFFSLMFLAVVVAAFMMKV